MSMRIEKLRINNFRGIPELKVEPDGGNLCLVGPNGSGKSSVIEAVDFLLTGSIQDLSGEGTGGISIREHGPYLRSDIEDAWVEGTFTDGTYSITVKRRLSDRNTLECDEEIPSEIETLMDSAKKGQHYLSRQEILKFIVARAQNRSEHLRALLDLSDVRQSRLELQGAAENLETRASELERERDSQRSRLVGLFEDAESLDDVLPLVNDIREVFGGGPLEELDSEVEFRSGLESPTDQASASPLQSNRTKELLDSIREWFEETADDFWEEYETILDLVEDVRENEESRRDLEAFDFIQSGRDLIDDDTTECPLCLTEWDPQDLQALLEQREENARKAKQLRTEIDEAQSDALSALTDVRTAVVSLLDILEQHEDYETEALASFRETLIEIETQLGTNLIDEVPLEALEETDRSDTLEPTEVEALIADYHRRAEDLPELDQLQADWDDLGSAYEYYSSYTHLKDQAAATRDAANEMEAVAKAFVSARDDVLNDTYEAISDRFEEFYTTLHHDEDNFSPSIEPTETGLDISVGFHGEGEHPPHALHSEGHQDSMGLCLFLALCDHLESDSLSLVMLDDVVMSIDAEHRRPLAELLQKEISDDFQLLITTHDELWYRHLKTEGVVTTSNTVKFTGWSLGDGPVRVDQLADDWDRIENLLDEGDVEGAAHRLRHTAEWFLREACHQFNARVQFKANGLWTLGDFMSPAQSKFKELVKKAREAEQSWGNEIEEINELDDERSNIYRRLNQHIGAVNPNVHYNENQWATFTPHEMEEVVEAFNDLYNLFWCENCSSCLRVETADHEESLFRCTCGQKANWTLQVREEEE